jgi:hypothetical protein
LDTTSSAARNMTIITLARLGVFNVPPIAEPDGVW